MALPEIRKTPEGQYRGIYTFGGFRVDAPINQKLTTSTEWRELDAFLTGSRLVLNWMNNFQKRKFAETTNTPFPSSYVAKNDPNNTRQSVITLLGKIDDLSNGRASPEERQQRVSNIHELTSQAQQLEEFSSKEDLAISKTAIYINNKRMLS